MSRSDETAGNVRGLNLTVAHFDSQNLNILSYTVDIVERNIARGVKLNRRNVEEFWIQNVKEVFGEKSERRAELLEQVCVDLKAS